MSRYIAKRVVRGLFVLYGVLTIAFFVLRLSGDPGALMLPPTATSEDIAAFNRAYGYDRPLFVQYVDFLTGAAQGDFGSSVSYPAPAMDLMLDRLPATLELVLVSFVGGAIIAFVLAIVIQLSESYRLATLMLWLGVARQAIPTFVFGVLLVLIFSVRLQWFPSLGREGLDSLVLPSVTLGSFEVVLYLRLLLSAFGDQEQQDYVRTAQSKGQTRLRVVLRHMLPNALPPALTVAGVAFGQLLAGTIIIETVFNWPGIGQLTVQAVILKDFPLVAAGLFVVSLGIVLMSLAVDLLSARLDPRVRLT